MEIKIPETSKEKSFINDIESKIASFRKDIREMIEYIYRENKNGRTYINLESEQQVVDSLTHELNASIRSSISKIENHLYRTDMFRFGSMED